jgi:hypothetical protein
MPPRSDTSSRSGAAGLQALAAPGLVAAGAVRLFLGASRDSTAAEWGGHALALVGVPLLLSAGRPGRILSGLLDLTG